MQGNNDLKNRFLMIPVPLDDAIDSGIDLDGVIQTSAVDGKIIIENVDEAEDFVCGQDCESCPLFEPDCNEDCEDCPCCCPECGGCMCDMTILEGEKDDE